MQSLEVQLKPGPTYNKNPVSIKSLLCLNAGHMMQKRESAS